MSTQFTYEDALAAIWARSGYDRGFISNPFAGDDAARLGLLRTDGTLALMGHPERQLRIVHVAGSKGKGSTTVTIDSILRAAGHRVGRFTSPHLHSYRERLIVDDELIAPEDFAAITQETLVAAKKLEAEQPALGQVTAWELSTAMALAWFARASCEFAVIEVGLGGTLDATNVVGPEVSVITRLDFEHTAILGDTMAEIADNKAGIIKPGKPVISARQPEDGMRVIRTRAAELGSRLLVAGEDFATEGTDRDFTFSGPWGTLPTLHTALPGDHQVENAALAIATVRTITEVDDDAIRQGLAQVVHPGRFEIVTHPTGTTIVIDGAHSPVAARALVATVQDRYPDQRAAIVIGMLQDKDAVHFVPPLADIASAWFVLPPQSPRARPASEVIHEIPETTVPIAAFENMEQALAAAIASSPSLIVVTGSLTTVAEARVALGLAIPDISPASLPRVS